MAGRPSPRTRVLLDDAEFLVIERPDGQILRRLKTGANRHGLPETWPLDEQHATPAQAFRYARSIEAQAWQREETAQ